MAALIRLSWCALEPPDCILVLSSRSLVLIIVTFLNLVPYVATTEKSGWLHSSGVRMQMSRHDCIAVIRSSRPLVLIIVTFLNVVPYVATFPLMFLR